MLIQIEMPIAQFWVKAYAWAQYEVDPSRWSA